MTFDQKLSLANFAVSLLTPLVLIGIGYLLDRRVKNFERAAEHRRKLSENRFQIYRDIGRELNDIYSYFRHAGKWHELSASDVLHRKRELDCNLYTFRPLFSDTLFSRYKDFMRAAFDEQDPVRANARLRTTWQWRAEEEDQASQARFTGEDNRDAIKRAYRRFMDCLSVELDVRSPDTREMIDP